MDERGVDISITPFSFQMSRENAIIFLREIHTHIEYLQNAYAGNGPLQLSPTVSQEKVRFPEL